MPSSPSRPPAAEEVSDAEMADGEVAPRHATDSVGGGAANQVAPGSAGEEDEEIYDDDESSDYNSYDDDDDHSDESGSYYEDHEEEEEQEGAGGDRASGSAEEKAASAGVGGGRKAEGSPRAAATCCICMDPWASYGAHRICCIPCGHVYGRSCLERWLLRGGNTSAKCPQCGQRFKHRHIINLYSTVHLWNDCCYKEAYFRYLNLYRQECAEHDAKQTCLQDYRAEQIQNMYLAMENGTRAPPMGPPPPNPGPAPVMLTIEEFLARGGDGTPGSHGSNVGGGSSAPGDGTLASRSPVTLVHNLGGDAGGGSTSTRGSPLF